MPRLPNVAQLAVEDDKRTWIRDLRSASGEAQKYGRGVSSG